MITPVIGSRLNVYIFLNGIILFCVSICGYEVHMDILFHFERKSTFNI